MKPTATRDATHNFTAPGNWNEKSDGKCGDLQVRMELMGERKIIELFSTWKPSPGELAVLREGGVVEVGVCAHIQPVMQVNVVEPVVTPINDDIAMHAEKPPITINEDGHGT